MDEVAHSGPQSLFERLCPGGQRSDDSTVGRLRYRCGGATNLVHRQYDSCALADKGDCELAPLAP
jgi:hypothetical protein